MGNRKLIIAVVVLIVALGGAGLFWSTQSSRSINVRNATAVGGKNTADSETSSTVEMADASSTPSLNPSSTGNATASIASWPIPSATFAVVTSSTFIFPTTPIDTAAYDAKMLALANLPPPRIVKTVVTTTTGTTTIMKAVPVVTGWPVTGSPYPVAGALLPFDRIVAYYGNLYSTQMGVLGQYPAPQMLAMLASTTAMWQAADPSTPTIPALDYIAVTAQGSPGPDGKYRLRMPPSQINEILTMANEVNGIVFLDVQVGLSNVETEVPLLEPYLKLPQVELSLDPEFAMHDGERPGTVIGTMDASDINWAVNYLATLVTQYNLPPKILVVHRFTQAMVTNVPEIKPLPQVQIVMDMDGFGSPAKKINTYQSFIASEPIQFTGFKLFYKNDAIPTIGGHLMTPADVLKLAPQPSYIQYE